MSVKSCSVLLVADVASKSCASTGFLSLFSNSNRGGSGTVWIVALAVIWTSTLLAGDDLPWTATGELRPDDGRGVNTTAVAIDPALGLAFAGSLTGRIYLRPDGGSLAPVASDDAAITSAQTLVSIEVLDNDFVPGGGDLVPDSIEIVVAPLHGAALPHPSGRVDYLPDPGFVGSDSFSYTVDSAAGTTSAPAIVTITVTAQILGFEPEELDFGAVVPGQASGAVNVRVINQGPSPARIGLPVWSGDTGPFELLNQNCSGSLLGPDEACGISLRFAPIDADSAHATFSFQGAGSELLLSGQGGSSPDDRIFADSFE